MRLRCVMMGHPVCILCGSPERHASSGVCCLKSSRAAFLASREPCVLRTVADIRPGVAFRVRDFSNVERQKTNRWTLIS